MKCYLVGGAVRDQLLNIPVKDRDWVVVGETPQSMLDAGFQVKDPDFHVYLHPDSGEEYALARREVKQGQGYKGFGIDIAPDITLEEDLIRRDLTINAIAQNKAGELIDPLGGLQDIEEGFLRHVSPAFNEDPFRVLRVARFAAKLGHLGFRLAHGTHRRIQAVATSGELHTLSSDRLWGEMEKALMTLQPWRFFEVLHQAGALPQVFPELEPVYGDAKAHAQSSVVPRKALQRVSRQTNDVSIRTVVILQFAETTDSLGAWIDRYPITRKTKALLSFVIEYRACWQQRMQREATSILMLIKASHALKTTERLDDFLQICGVCWNTDKQKKERVIRQSLAACQTVKVKDLMAQGIQGKALGEALDMAYLGKIQSVVVECRN